MSYTSGPVGKRKITTTARVVHDPNLENVGGVPSTSAAVFITAGEHELGFIHGQSTDDALEDLDAVIELLKDTRMALTRMGEDIRRYGDRKRFTLRIGGPGTAGDASVTNSEMDMSPAERDKRYQRNAAIQNGDFPPGTPQEVRSGRVKIGSMKLEEYHEMHRMIDRAEALKERQAAGRDAVALGLQRHQDESPNEKDL